MLNNFNGVEWKNVRKCAESITSTTNTEDNFNLCTVSVHINTHSGKVTSHGLYPQVCNLITEFSKWKGEATAKVCCIGTVTVHNITLHASLFCSKQKQLTVKQLTVTAPAPHLPPHQP